MERILEPELMDDPHQAQTYAQADFSASNQWFVDHLAQVFPDQLPRAIDLGCGPGDVVIRLARAQPKLHITAIDGSAAMIALARQAVDAAGLQHRITLLEARLPGLPLDERSFDAVLSKDLLHHLPNPLVFWQEVRRLAKPGAVVFVMDLFRPATTDEAHAIVERVAPDGGPILKTDFYNSLCAAFAVAEVQMQLATAGLDLAVTPVSERHMLIQGHL